MLKGDLMGFNGNLMMFLLGYNIIGNGIYNTNYIAD